MSRMNDLSLEIHQMLDEGFRPTTIWQGFPVSRGRPDSKRLGFPVVILPYPVVPPPCAGE